MKADTAAIRHFLERVHGPEPQGWLTIWTRQDKATKAFDLSQEDDVDRAVEYASTHAATQDVYAAVGLQDAQPKGNSRGGEEQVHSLPGVWLDIDIRGPAHKSPQLPATEEEASTLIESVGVSPSVVVRTGFGLQVYWLFREPYVIENEGERQNLRSISRRFQQFVRLAAQARGWHLDPTADLCRLLRLPGTFNRKLPDHIRVVTAEYSDAVYCVDEIDELIGTVDDPEQARPSSRPTLPPAKLPLILDGCAWMKHCRDDAVSLAEPEWYQALTVVARCEDAEGWAHELSGPYPQYSRSETRRKLIQASASDIAPVTCLYVGSTLNGIQYCQGCAFGGSINSPITIGRMSASTIAEIGEPEPFTDLGNARRFVKRYGGTLMYCELWGRWLIWDGRRWKQDETLEALKLAGMLIRELRAAAQNIPDEEKRKAFFAHLVRSESHRALTSMLRIAKADPHLAIHPADLDRDPWLLTFANGTIDLRNGVISAHQQTHRITKLAPAGHDSAATCPNWLAFLDLIMNGNTRLIGFLQRAIGICLTGVTSEKALFILHGGSDNGKSTLIDTIQLLLGDYAVRTPTETLLRKREGAIPNDIAKLKGARLVWATESDRGSRLSESLIKEMTGGDKLAARFMRGEFFEFYPEFKLWLATNHKPQVRGDRALWNRIKLIPFDVAIPKEQQKPRHEVMAMFRAEFSGIFNWALEGCMEWQRSGLGVPEEVVKATEAYESEQDTFAMFLDEKCVCVTSACELSLPLYKAYKEWAEQYGEYPASHKIFSSLLAERGFKKEKTRVGILYRGIALRSADHYDTPPVDSLRARRSVRDQEEGEAI